MVDIVMPQLGESVAEGTVTKWLVQEGDAVTKQQPIVVVSTDKADSEVTSTVAGRVVKRVAAEGETLATGRVLCTIDPSASVATTPTSADAPRAPAPPVAAEPIRSSSPSGSSPLASPATRQEAREQGVDLTQLTPTGEHGRITRDDVRRAAQGSESAPPAAPPAAILRAPVHAAEAAPALAKVTEAPPGRLAAPAPSPASSPDVTELTALLNPPPAATAWPGFGTGFGAYKLPPYTPKPGDKVVPFTRRRRITADHMVFSKVTAPHVVTVAEVDLHAVSRLRDAHKDRLKAEGVSLTFLAFVCAATVRALREHPELNARVLENAYVVLKDIHLGIAVDTPGGLIVPNIKNADHLSVRGLGMQIEQTAARARAGKVTADDLTGTTFSVSNPGMKGNLFGGAILSQPNVGILRMGEIKKRAVVVTKDGEDTIAIHPVMYVALSYDHRIIDGVLANSFLWRIGDLLQRAEFEV